jgi:hemoglobin/transferrin/lactoferrin receptor protein
MLGLDERARALLLSISVISLACGSSLAAHAQVADSQVDAAKPKPAKRKKSAAQQQVRQDAPWQTAYAQVGAPTQQPLDTITVAASKTEERAIDALAPVSVMTLEQIEARQASTVGGLIYDKPGVWLQNRGDDPSTSINIRGLQDFGRVAVVVDGARQNYQRTGHFANGSFFLNPELIGGIDIVRGPTANIYGSGAIGGVASFRTKDVEDVVRAGERWGVDMNTIVGSNQGRALGSIFGGAHVNPNVDVFAGGTYSGQGNYKDGTDYEVANSSNHLTSGIAKITVRPADGHEVKLSSVFQEFLYGVGQPARVRGAPNTVNLPVTMFGDPNGGTSVYASDVRNYTNSLGWKYSEPDNKLFDWDSRIYWNRTESNQVKTADASGSSLGGCLARGLAGNDVTGCVGDPRGYILDTYGFDVHNTSRLDAGDFQHAFTYGADGFQDQVTSTDMTGTSDVTTPGGRRNVFGGFAQWKANYKSLLEVISGVRYDNYQLTSAAGGNSGDRFSPKITVGLLPNAAITPYASYAEGYRAPSITETLVNGSHAATSPSGGDALFQCPSGAPRYGAGPPNNAATSTFCFLPNPNLRPEVGKTTEVGFNVKRNDLFTAGDTFRGKFNLFQNNIDDYIDQVAFGTPQDLTAFGAGIYLPFLQYQNISAARIQGFEAETMYDASAWFVGVSGTLQEGKNLQTGVGLYSVSPQRVTTTAGIRFAEQRALFSVMWTSVAGNTNIPSNYLPATSFDLVNLYLSFKPTADLTLSASVENLLNQYYRPYAVPGFSSTDSQNDTKWASAGAGITFKGGLKYHFGG